jgi:hypothetical protein
MPAAIILASTEYHLPMAQQGSFGAAGLGGPDSLETALTERSLQLATTFRESLGWLYTGESAERLVASCN